MDLPIVMRQAVTTADRWRWILAAVTGGLIAGAMWLALPWVHDRAALLSAVVPPRWITIAYVMVMTLSGVVALMGPWRAVSDVDYTWTIDETAVGVRARYVIGQRSWTWPLSQISGVRVRKVWGWGDDPDRFCVQLRLGVGKWRSVRCAIDDSDAQAFARLVNEALALRSD